MPALRYSLRTLISSPAFSVGPWRRQRETVTELRAFQARRLRAVVAHAAVEVAFYRRWLAGVEVEGIRGQEDLRALPAVAKRELRRAPSVDLLTRGADRRRLLELRTSGSTGEPFNIFRSWSEDLRLLAFIWRAWSDLGVRINDRCVRVARFQKHDGGWRSGLGRWLRRFGRREVTCQQPLEGVIEALRRHDPTVLNGYPGVLAMVAPRLRDAGGRTIRPRLVLTGGEELSGTTRRSIAAGFDAPVRDLYGTYEVGLLAWECPRSGLYHVCDDSVVLEVLRDDGQPAGPGEEGDVVVTGLHSYTMPFLRYRLGDRAVRGPTPCPCGQPFSTLERVRGRAVDYFRLPGGRLLHHYDFMSPAMRRAGVRDWIARYQIVQEREDLFVLRLALMDPARRGEFERLREEVLLAVGRGVEVRLEFVDELAFEPSGKFRLATSKVAAPE